MPRVLPRTSCAPLAVFRQTPLVRQRRFLRDPAHQHDDLAQHQFGHRAGVGVGSVEHRDSLAFRRVHVYVVGADAEAADAEQAPRRRQDLSGQPGLRTDAEDMRFREQAAERVVVGSTRKRLDVDIAGVAQRLHGTGMDALGEHDADAITGDWIGVSPPLLRLSGAARTCRRRRPRSSASARRVSRSRREDGCR